MAVKLIERKKISDQKRKSLTVLLRKEIRRPESEPRPKNAPIVIVQTDQDSSSLSFYVVWDEFRGIDSETRFYIIHDAVQAERPKDIPRSIGMDGLTMREAYSNSMLEAVLE